MGTLADTWIYSALMILNSKATGVSQLSLVVLAMTSQHTAPSCIALFLMLAFDPGFTL